jgi:hypothetical protein
MTAPRVKQVTLANQSLLCPMDNFLPDLYL